MASILKRVSILATMAIVTAEIQTSLLVIKLKSGNVKNSRHTYIN
jgi:hypothetical protein